MPIPTVDTFEQDIVSEIKTKEATIGDIASSNGDIGNPPIKNDGTTTLPFIIIGLILLIAIIGLGAYFGISYLSPSRATQASTQSATTTPKLTASSLSPTLDTAVGPFLSKVTKRGDGYVIGVLSYEDVYAYMLRNESMYADELAHAVGSPREVGASSTPFTFADVTLSNQNIRVGTSGSSTIAYAFVNGTALLISSSTDGILSLRSAILH